jgi:hypothetical protein
MLMRNDRWLRMSLLASIVSALPALAATSSTPVSTAPKQGDMAVSANLGFAHPFDGPFDGVEPVLNGTFEYFTTPRISWRGLLGITSFDSDDPGDVSVDSTYFNANFVYNWERGKLHPYATAGTRPARRLRRVGLRRERRRRPVLVPRIALGAQVRRDGPRADRRGPQHRAHGHGGRDLLVLTL